MNTGYRELATVEHPFLGDRRGQAEKLRVTKRAQKSKSEDYKQQANVKDDNGWRLFLSLPQ
jgi:hypothetical protein